MKIIVQVEVEMCGQISKEMVENFVAVLLSGEQVTTGVDGSIRMKNPKFSILSSTS